MQQIRRGIVDICAGSVADFMQIEAADIRGHSYGDALIRIDKNRRKRDRQKRRFFELSVVIVDEIHHILIDVLEKLLADFLELYLRIPRCGVRHVAGILFSEISLGIYIRVQQRSVSARHSDQRIVNRLIAVRIELHRLSHNVCRFCTASAQETFFVHGI